MSNLFDAEAWFDRLSGKPLTLSSFLAPVLTFLRGKTDWAIAEAFQIEHIVKVETYQDVIDLPPIHLESDSKVHFWLCHKHRNQNAAIQNTATGPIAVLRDLSSLRNRSTASCWTLHDSKRSNRGIGNITALAKHETADQIVNRCLIVMRGLVVDARSLYRRSTTLGTAAEELWSIPPIFSPITCPVKMMRWVEESPSCLDVCRPNKVPGVRFARLDLPNLFSGPI